MEAILAVGALAYWMAAMQAERGMFGLPAWDGTILSLFVPPASSSPPLRSALAATIPTFLTQASPTGSPVPPVARSTSPFFTSTTAANMEHVAGNPASARHFLTTLSLTSWLLVILLLLVSLGCGHHIYDLRTRLARAQNDHLESEATFFQLLARTRQLLAFLHEKQSALKKSTKLSEDNEQIRAQLADLERQMAALRALVPRTKTPPIPAPSSSDVPPSPPPPAATIPPSPPPPAITTTTPPAPRAETPPPPPSPRLQWADNTLTPEPIGDTAGENPAEDGTKKKKRRRKSRPKSWHVRQEERRAGKDGAGEGASGGGEGEGEGEEVEE